MAVAEFIKEIGCVFDVRRALRRIAHDRRGILEWIANVAIPVAARADQHVHRISGAIVKTRCGIESAAIVSPADFLFVERVADGPKRRGWCSGTSVDRGRVELAVREEARTRV